MPLKLTWNSPEGADTVKRVLSVRIPAWKGGLHERQQEAVLRILDGEDVLLCTATGDGKSALFIVPILCHQELSKNPDLYPKFPVRRHALGLIVTPTKGLARNIVDGLAKYDISALAYDRETISLAAIQKRRLVTEITSCSNYSVVCIDPEHLHAAAWRKILQNADVRSNLLYSCIEEVHLAEEWASFRKAYGGVGSWLRGRLPPDVSVFGQTATLLPGATTTALCKSLGFRAPNFTLLRYSNERPDIQLIMEPLKGGISSTSFPQLLDFINTGRKTIIYAPSLEIVTRIYRYLLRMEPPGVNHSERVRQYTALCSPLFNAATLRLMETPGSNLQIIIATVALANGVHCAGLEDCISVGMPSTLSQSEQQGGRVARLPGTTGRSIILYQPTDVTKAKKYFAELGAPSSSTLLNVQNGTRRRRKAPPSEPIDPAKAELLVETVCLTAARNRIWQNAPLETTELDCKSAGRSLFCALCAKRHNQVITWTASQSVPPPFLTPPPSTATRKPRSLQLRKKELASVQEKLDEFATKLFKNTFRQPGHQYRPKSWFFSPSLQTVLLDRFLQISSRDELESIVVAAQWPFCVESWIDTLWGVVDSAAKLVVSQRPKKSRGQARASGRGAKRKRAEPEEEESDVFSDSNSSSSDSEDETGVDESEPMAMESAPPPSLSVPVPSHSGRKRPLDDSTNQPTLPKAPSAKLSMKEVMDGYGPVRTRRRRGEKPW